jgi:hypothetical protein
MRLIYFHRLRTLFAVTALLLPVFLPAYDRPIISGIHTEIVKGTDIAVSWTIPAQSDPPVTSLLVFRDKQPITMYIRLDELEPSAELPSDKASWTDSVPDYSNYYYAVIAVTKNGRYNILLPSINTTVTGAHLQIKPSKAALDKNASAQEKLYPAGAMREMPLPALDLIEGINSNGIQISNKSREQAKTLALSVPAEQTLPLQPSVFAEDYISPDGGDDYLLFETLRTTFARKKYKDAVIPLEKLIGTNLNEKVINRGIFYLGESYYFTGDYKNAVRCFLKTIEAYPLLSKKWIDSSLDYMSIPTDQSETTCQ